MGTECSGRNIIGENFWRGGKMNLAELEEMASLLEEEDMLRLNKEIIVHLRKRGVKLREFKWNELEAS